MKLFCLGADDQERAATFDGHGTLCDLSARINGIAGDVVSNDGSGTQRQEAGQAQAHHRVAC